MAQMNVTPNKGKNVARKWYTDIDINLTPHPSNNDLVLKYDKEAVKRSLKNILLTNHYERPFKPSLGANLQGRLFQMDDEFTRQDIGDDIAKTIQKFEPRVRLFEIAFGEVGRNDLNITIHYEVQGTPQPQELTVLLKRVR